MGVPVIAIGVPTVVHAITIVSDALDMIGRESQVSPTAPGPMHRSSPPPPQSPMLDPNQINLLQGQGNPPVTSGVGNYQHEVGMMPFQVPIDAATKRDLIQRVLTPYMGTMVVTPKEIDVLIEDAAQVVAGGINGAFHPAIDQSELAFYTR